MKENTIYIKENNGIITASCLSVGKVFTKAINKDQGIEFPIIEACRVRMNVDKGNKVWKDYPVIRE